MTLCNQDHSQLRRPAADLLGTIQENTATKTYFSLRDSDVIREISEKSGAVVYAKHNWEQSLADVQAGRVGLRHAQAAKDGSPRVGVEEVLGNRLSLQDIEDHSLHPNHSIMNFGLRDKATQYSGCFAVRNDWVMPLDTYLRRLEQTPWPEADERTIVVPGEWTVPDFRQVVELPPSPDESDSIRDHLRDIKRRLDSKSRRRRKTT